MLGVAHTRRLFILCNSEVSQQVTPSSDRRTPVSLADIEEEARTAGRSPTSDVVKIERQHMGSDKMRTHDAPLDMGYRELPGTKLLLQVTHCRVILAWGFPGILGPIHFWALKPVPAGLNGHAGEWGRSTGRRLIGGDGVLFVISWFGTAEH